MSWKYSVTLKSFSSQPDIPWGVIKHQLPLDDTYDTNLLYRDGYDLVWGPSGSLEDRITAGQACAERLPWIVPDEDYAVRLKRETPERLKNMTLIELRRTLETLPDDWERQWIAPYIIGLLNYEEKRQQDSAAMVAANGDGDDD